MITDIRRPWRQFRAICAVTLKERLTYTAWFWSDIAGQLVMMLIYLFFWQAIYVGRTVVGGMTEEQTIAYVLVANAVGMVIRWSMIWEFGVMLRSGSIAVELLRPMDFQLRMYAWMFTTVGGTMLQHMVLLGLVAWLFLGLALPTSPLVWGWFLLSLLVGQGVLFCFDWTISLVSFYSTEVRGLLILRDGIVVFFSGLIIPLAMMPVWLQRVAAFLPFGQMLNTPVQILTGITPLSAAPGALLTQLLWLAGLLLVSRPAFRIAIRRVTVQGG